MNKDNISINRLIPKKKLIRILQKAGVKRISQKALDEINIQFCIELEIIAKMAKEKIEVKGKKTLEQRDIKEIIKEKNKIEYPEI